MIKSIGHIIVSGMLLVSVTGLTINMHYCYDHLYDMALNAPAHSCCDPDSDKGHCDNHSHADESSHCDDRVIRIHTESDMMLAGAIMLPENLQAIDLMFIPGHNVGLTDEVSDGRLAEYPRKKPPHLREVDLPTIQVFII